MRRNGRQCLWCDVEGATAQVFLAKGNTLRNRQLEGPTQVALQNRFVAILARLDNEQLEAWATWMHWKVVGQAGGPAGWSNLCSP